MEENEGETEDLAEDLAEGLVSILDRRLSEVAVCHNSQSAALLSSSGLVMYFSTLPAPSSSAPCILTILTHLRVCVKICILTHPLGRCGCSPLEKKILNLQQRRWGRRAAPL